MAYLWRNIGRVQPQGPVEIDRNHLIAQGLRDYVLINQSGHPINLATNKRSTLFTPGIYRAYARGPGQRFNGSTQALGFADSVFANLTEGTYGCGFAHTTAALDRRLIGHGSTASNNPLITMETRPSINSQGLRVTVRDLVGTTSQIIQNGTFPTSNDGSLHHVVTRFQLGGGVHDIWQNGVLERAATTTGSAGTIATDRWAIGGLARAAIVSPIAGDIFWAANWDRVITPDAAAWVTREPYALLRTRAQRIYYVPTGGGGDEDASPTGVFGGGSAGSLSLTVSSTAILSGVSATGAAGSLTAYAGASANILGVQSQGHVGSVSIAATALVATVGVSAAGHAGALTALAGAIQPVTGVGAGGGVGQLTLTLSSQVSLDGVAGIANIGSLSVLTGQIQQVTGVTATGAAGSVTLSHSTVAALAGVGALGRIGNLGLEYSTYAMLPGAAATGLAGHLTATTIGSSYQRRIVSTAVAHRFTSSALSHIYTSTARH